MNKYILNLGYNDNGGCGACAFPIIAIWSPELILYACFCFSRVRELGMLLRLAP